MPDAVRAEVAGRTRVDLHELIALGLRLPRARRGLRTSVLAPQAGNDAGRIRGRGMDYLESRAYQSGDDVRHLDWRLTARRGQLHTKLFQEERERSLLLLLDCNAGMYFGTRARFKSVQAARAAAAAAWYAARAGERVGVLAVGGCRGERRATAGQRGALLICGALAAWDRRARECPPETLSDALQRARSPLRGAGRVVIISDGLACDPAVRTPLSVLCRHSQLILLTVADALELAPPPPGRYPLAHDGRRDVADLTDPASRSAFGKALGAGPARMADLASALHVPASVIDTRVDPCETVVALLGRPPRQDT